MSDRIDSRLWAKYDRLPGPYPLGCHLADTAAVAGELWEVYLTEGQRQRIEMGFGVNARDARAMISFWAGLHDLGKCCPSFQAQPSGPHPCFLAESAFAAPSGWMHQDAVSHARVTHLVLPAELQHFGYDATSRPSKSPAHQIAQILGGHHGVYGTALDRTTMTRPGRTEPRIGTAPGWTKQRTALVNLVHELCGQPPAPTQVAPGGVAVMATGLIILADWIASSTTWVNDRLKEWNTAADHDYTAHYARALKAAPAAVAQAQLHTPTWRPASSFQDVFPHITQPHPLQQDLADRLPGLVRRTDPSVPRAGLVLITAPTGDGKTESALYAARLLGAAAGQPGLAVLLPTMATTDAMWTRVRDYTSRNTLTPTPVTLLHALAWLNDDYNDTEEQLTGERTATAAGEWLKGRHRGLIAGVTTGTWDQGALAALPVRFNALRWLGLAGKTVIIDEAHAYDAYGHALTTRLLQWLGHLGTPVVLLSATLSGSIARRLVDAYRTGAGHHTPSTTTPTYPGWLYADATTGTVTTSPTIPTTRAHPLAIDLHHAPHTHNPDHDGRAARLKQELSPPYDEHQDPGSVLVVCNTVPDAQHTYQALLQRTGTRHPRVLLLHARMPVWQREQLTRTVLTLLGPKSRRPQEPVIVVSTQVAEQSLDVDFDLVISDLAPLAQLLQRAGRGHRHELGERGKRPRWAHKPRLVILAPTGQLPPRAWGDVYDGALLRRTRELLDQKQGKAIEVPGDIGDMIETVYTEFNDLADQALNDDRQRSVRETAQAAAAAAVAIPAPGDITDLYPVTDREIDPDLVVTRLGADSARILPVYVDANNTTWLDPRHTRPLPMPAPGQKRLTRDTVADLIRITVQAPADYLPASDSNTRTPSEWKRTPVARDLRLLPHSTAPDGQCRPYQTNTHNVLLHADLGLVRSRS